MAEYRIRTRASREELEEVIRSIPKVLSGADSRDPLGLREGFAGRVAKSFFEGVWIDFIFKSRGARGVDGDVWERNTPEYLAYKKGKKRTDRWGSGQMPMNKPGGPHAYRTKSGAKKLGRGPGTGMLNRQQLGHWWKVYGKMLSRFAGRMNIKEAKARSAQIAWETVKATRGATTLLETYGRKRHKVLINTEKLFRSLRPGRMTDVSGYNGQYIRERSQHFRIMKRRIEVGTKVKYARYHHEGRGNNPARRLWPKELPAEWLEKINEEVTQQMVALAESYKE